MEQRLPPMRRLKGTELMGHERPICNARFEVRFTQHRTYRSVAAISDETGQ